MATPLISPASRRIALLSASVFVLTASFRFLALTNFPNDHFVHLAPAWQMLSGDWPTRDFQDPGHPLMCAMSALAQRLLGTTLFAEAVLVVIAFGAAAVLTLLAVRELTGSLLLAVAAVAFEVLIVPRTYSYPKILLYAAAFLVFQRYVTRPTRGRLVTMAVVTVVAFLFRHDHGLFLWAGGAITAMLVRPAEPSHRLRAAVQYTVLVGLLTLPYLIYVQVYEGVWQYFLTGVEFSVREAAHSAHVWPAPFGSDRPYAVLVYLYHLLPWLAAWIAIAGRRKGDGERVVARVLPTAAVALFVNISFLRDPLVTRVPDAIVPAVMLGAWLMTQVQAMNRRAVLVPLALALVALAAWATLLVGNTRDEIDRMGLTSLLSVPERFAQRRDQLRARFDPQEMPTRTVARMQPFFEYLDRCTSPGDRLLTAGFMPEVPYYARRAYAAGQNVFMYGYYGSPENQRLAIERLGRQSVPFVLVPSDYASDLETDFPLVNGYITARYAHLVTLNVDENLDVTILVEKTRQQVSRDPATGWPCFR